MRHVIHIPQVRPIKLGRAAVLREQRHADACYLEGYEAAPMAIASGPPPQAWSFPWRTLPYWHGVRVGLTHYPRLLGA